MNFIFKDGLLTADGLTIKVTKHRGGVYHGHLIENENKTVVAINVGDDWSHGETLEEAKKDLLFKTSNRDTSMYNHLTRDSIVTIAEAVKLYRDVTGACLFGTREVREGFGKPDEYEITVDEIIDLSRGYFGHSKFVEFFC